MAIAKLIPSSYSLSNAGLSIVDSRNMYTDTDGDTFATVTNQSDSTASCYLYLDGFDFSVIPDDAVVSSYTVKLKARENGISTSSSFAPRLVGIDATCQPLKSNVQVLTFDCQNSWETINTRDFKIEINCRKSNKNNTGFIYIYGAEIEVEYTTPSYTTITTSVVGLGSVCPSGTHKVHSGSTDSLVITPDRVEAKVFATKNGIDISELLIPHGKKYILSTSLGDCTIISGGFNSLDATYFTGIVGHGVDATRTISNYHSNSSTTVFEYNMSFSEIPDNATIEKVYCKVNGHAENTSSSCMSVQLKSGSTYLSDKVDFKITGTNNAVIVLEATPTISQLQSLTLECEVGSFGGAINGATCYVEYSVADKYPSYYTYTYTADEDADIIITIEPVIDDTISFKSNGVWIEAVDVYKKVNGSWIKCDDVTDVFDSNMNYISGNV